MQPFTFLSSIFKKKPTLADGFSHIFTDSKGNKWYAINNPANIHATRALNAWGYSRDAEFGLSKEKLGIACDKMNEAINKKDISSLAKIVGVIEAGLNLYAEESILLNLATCYTFLNDEKNDGYKDFIQEKKRDIWRTDPVCKAFFFAVVSQIHAEIFRIAEYECPRIFGKGKARVRPDKLPSAEEIVESKTKFTKEVNELNERVSKSSGRNPDENLNKTWGDWLATVTVVLDMEEKDRRNKTRK